MKKIGMMAILLLAAAGGAHAEEWYIPRPTHLAGEHAGEVGTRFQFFFDRDGIEFDRGFDAILHARYSPRKRVELYIEGPYSYRERERASFAQQKLHTVDEEGWGDIFTQISYDLTSGDDWKVMVSTDAVFPTGKNQFDHDRQLGDGHYKIAPGITYIKIVDPAALFAYAGHQWTVPRHLIGTGKIEPGEAFRFRVGISVMLHPRLRTSFYTAGDIVGHTRIRSIQSAGSDRDVVRFGTGLDLTVSENLSVNWNAAFGVTDLATDAVLSFGLSRPF